MDRGIDPGQDRANGQAARKDPAPRGDSIIENNPSHPGGPARPLDFVFLLRPMILIPVWTFYLLGAHHGSTSSGQQIQLQNLLVGFASFTALLGAIYIINQIADRKADLANRKLFLIPQSIITLRAAWLETGLLAAVSLLAGLFFLPPGYFWILISSLALGAIYSLEPVRLKKRPFFDVTANAVGNGVLNTMAGWLAIGAPLSGLTVLLPYPLAVASVHLTTTLADIEGDMHSGLKTSGVLLGPHRGIMISTGLMIAAVASAALVGNRLAFYASLFSLPIFLLPAYSVRKAFSPSGILLPAKAATLIFSVTAGFLFPLYIPFVALVILFTRLYYRRRFQMSYPSF